MPCEGADGVGEVSKGEAGGKALWGYFRFLLDRFQKEVSSNDVEDLNV